MQGCNPSTDCGACTVVAGAGFKVRPRRNQNIYGEAIVAVNPGGLGAAPPNQKMASSLLLVSSFGTLSFAFLGLLHPVAGDVQFQDDAVVDEAVDRGSRCHRVFEDGLPLRKG